MPLVRIDLRQGKDSTYREAIVGVVHEALVGVGVPKDDRFQVVSEHEQSNFIFDPEYLGIRRSSDLVIIQITWNEGRTVEQKKAIYEAIADGLRARLSLRREDVFISLVEVKRRTGLSATALRNTRRERLVQR
jgi:phenylpyruvate tautomerase PptA (4-oxalocrotonate tautomerase family)